MIVYARPLVLLLILLIFQDIKNIKGAVFATDFCTYVVHDDGSGPRGNDTSQDELSCCSSGNCVFNSLSDALVAATSNNILINLTTNINLTSNVTIDHIANIIIYGVNSPTVHCTNTGSVIFISCTNITITGIIWKGWDENNINIPAIQLYNSSGVTIQGCSFHNLTGQAVVLLSMVSDVQITSCWFTHNNQYGGHGAALYYSSENNDQLSLVINNCSFTSNGPAKSVLYIDGSTGEVYENALVSIQNSVFSNNQGVPINVSHMHLHLGGNVLFQQNTADNGGAIFGIVSIIEVDNNATIYFNNNTADSNGGAVYLHNSSISFDVSSSAQFKGNNVNANGGSIFLESRSQISFSENSTATFTSNIASRYGGAIYLWMSDISIINSEIMFLNNSVAQDGGVFYLQHSNFTINNNSQVVFINNSANSGVVYLYSHSKISSNNSLITFTRNTAIRYGGAIFATQHSAIVFNNSLVTFVGNTAYYCGAVCIGYYTFISFNGHSIVTFNNNSAYRYGGAVLIDYNSQISFSGTSEVKFNTNKIRYSGGGAIYVYISCHIYFGGASVVTFNNNSARYSGGGGAIYAFSSSHISYSDTSVVKFCRNTARSGGGAIYVQYTEISFNDASMIIFDSNHAGSGGAIWATHDDTVITFNGTSVITFLTNTASQYGGAMYIQDGSKILFDERTSVTFHTNYATSGSALYSTSECSLWFEGNSVVTFAGNRTASHGAAVYISDSNAYFLGSTSVQFFTNNSGTGPVNCSGKSLVLIVGNTANVYINSTTNQEIFFAQHQCRIIHVEEIDECLSNNGGCSQICRNTVNSFQCACFIGYTLASDQHTCIDIDECEVGNGGCQQICSNTEGSYFCSCSTGYSLNSDQLNCSDINECILGHPCIGDCVNSIGSFQCLCGGDQTYDNTTNRCISPDYCASDPCQHQCVSGSTSYQCYCQSGYNISSNGRNCIDINECQSDNGGCDQVCINQPGSYQCSCNSGYTLNSDGHNCSHIECQDPPTIDGLVFECSPPHYVGDACNVSCSQGHADLAGNDTIHCLITGYWEAANAACFIPMPNVPPSGLMLSTSSILENVPVGTAIGTFIVTDHNIDQTHTFILVDSAAGLFRITNTNLLVNGQLNYEVIRVYTIQVKVIDNGVPQLSTIFDLNITVLNENEPPSGATISNNVIAENIAANSLVGLLSATDPDDRQNVYFALLTTGGDMFALHNYCQLITTSSLNYETQTQFMLAIQVSDSASPSLSTISTITITVLDQNDAPTSITPTYLSIVENPFIRQTLTTLIVEDEDTNGTYSVTLTPSYGLAVNNLQLIVTDPIMLSFEAYPSHSVTMSMQLTDDEFTLTQQLTVHLTDVNEAPTEISLSSYSVHEHSAVGNVIGSFFATDPDINDTHTFILEEGLQNNLVRIDGISLLVNNDIDYETFSSFSIMVQVTDKGALNYTQNLTIFVINTNEAPNSFLFTPYPMYTCSSSRANAACLPENTQPPQSIGQLSASDPDGDHIVYTFSNFTEPASYFSLNDTSDPPQLMLYSNTLNYESRSYTNNVTINIEVADRFGQSSTYTITIEVLNVNDPPTTISLSNTVISESAAVGQIIGALEGMDEDEEDQLTYRLSYSPNGMFRIDGNHLVVAQTLNHESAVSIHNISITCSDGMTESNPIWFVIEISDANEPPINITLDRNTILENSPLHSTIGYITAHDEDVNEILLYQLDDDARGMFRLAQEGNNQVLQSLVSFDYEKKNSYRVVVRVTDSAGHFKLQVFTVQITDVDEPPENIVLNFNPVREGLSNITVGVFTAIDPEGRPLIFQINDTLNTFRVNQTAHENIFTLQLLSPLDFEETETLILEVTVTDGTTTPITQTIRITVLDQNDPPTDIVINNKTVTENVPRGTNVSSITVMDPDFTETFTCTLIDSSNGIFHTSGLSLIVHGNLNHEWQPLHTITAECADKGELVFIKAFNITVLNANDPPTDIEPNTGFIIAENLPAGTQFAVLTTVDEDSADSFEYLLLNHIDKFYIVGNVISTLAPLNFEEQSLYLVDIESTDSAGASIVVSITITVVDVNDAPDHVFFSTAPLVAENVAINTTVGRLVVHDEDTNDNHTFTTIGRSQYFTVDHHGVVYTSVLLDFEQLSQLTLDVVATDNGNLNKIESIVVQLMDVNEAPYGITLSDYVVAENQPAGVSVATITVEDQDYNETFSCQLTQPPPSYFEVTHNNGECINLITTNSTINYEITPSYLVTLSCYDHGGLEHSENISIVIINDNDPPTKIIFDNAQYSPPIDDRQLLLTAPVVQILEDAYVGQTVTGIMVVDEDINDMHTCMIINSTYPNAFSIASSGLTLQTNSSLRFKEINTAYLKINCSDGSEMTLADLRVVILDVNGPINSISLVPNVVSENSPSGTLVGVFNIVDFDDADNTTSQSVYILTLNSTSAPFVISRNSSHWYLSVSKQKALNYEIFPSFTFTILVQEINPVANFSFVQVIEVFLQDVNESPMQLTFSGGYTYMVLPSRTHPGIVVESFTVSDEDLNDIHTFEIIGGTVEDYFKISGLNLVLSKQLAPGRYDLLLDVIATDMGDLITIRHFVVSVIDNSTCNRTSNPCHENAICFVQHPDQVSCVCELGYSGDGYWCTDIDYCESNPCHPNNTIGGCIDDEGGIDSYTCNCIPGFEPPNCFNEIDECATIPCDLVGSLGCVDLLDDFNCNCERHYTGKMCEVFIDNCADNPCLNNGSCIDHLDEFTCACIAPYWGVHCENIDTVCDTDKTCPNNGECDSQTNTCQCKTPYIGNCQYCVEGCVVDSISGECVDYDECVSDLHPCGKNSSLTCINLKNRPCSYCCLDDSGNVQFCGPKESDEHINGQIHQDPEPASTSTITIAAGLLGGIVIVLLIIFGIACVKYRYVSKRFRVSNSTSQTQVKASYTCHSFANQTYIEPKADLQKDEVYVNTFPHSEIQTSAATIVSSKMDEQVENNPDEDIYTYI